MWQQTGQFINDLSFGAGFSYADAYKDMYNLANLTGVNQFSLTETELLENAQSMRDNKSALAVLLSNYSLVV